MGTMSNPMFGFSFAIINNNLAASGWSQVPGELDPQTEAQEAGCWGEPDGFL